MRELATLTIIAKTLADILVELRALRADLAAVPKRTRKKQA